MSKSVPPGVAALPLAFYESDQKDLTKNCYVTDPFLKLLKSPSERKVGTNRPLFKTPRKYE